MMFQEIMFPFALTLGDNLEHVLGTLFLTFSLLLSCYQEVRNSFIFFLTNSILSHTLHHNILPHHRLKVIGSSNMD